MIFSYAPEAGAETLLLRGEEYKYLIKARRHRVGDRLAFRCLKAPQTLYMYTLEEIGPKEATLRLESQEERIVAPHKKLHIGWCLIDPKSIEKVLAQLNESGVTQITFITCKRSQKDFRLDFARMERILEASNQQCGRSVPMVLETQRSIEAFVQRYPHSVLLDFGGGAITSDLEVVVVGCEGGIDPQERALFVSERIVSFDTPLVLRSESASVALSNKLVL
ncbi:MAG: 16S rRNA (uracil(1498)-N(3))-methyltransferase [Campylobacterales bacterium]|nr:16S rRNA (uracil(1498)-N(3))-methyltransferase [Campylobacterales bacterium]